MTKEKLKELALQYGLNDSDVNELSKVSGTDYAVERAAAEIAQRPKVLPLNHRHFWTPAELDALRRNGTHI